MVSILDILSGALPLMVDVRQTGGSPISDIDFSPFERVGAGEMDVGAEVP
jgi:hypothetical protein